MIYKRRGIVFSSSCRTCRHVYVKNLLTWKYIFINNDNHLNGEYNCDDQVCVCAYK